MAHFHALVDPRKARGKRYALVTLLVLVFLAKLSGMDGPSGIADWCQGRTAELVKLLGLSYAQMPSHHTIRRLFDTLLDETAFEERMQAYTTQQREKQSDTGVRVMDDKRLRGTLPPGETQGEATMAWYDPERQEVLAQQKIDPDEGEIPTGEKLLEQADLHAKIVLADALHTQRKLCQHIGQAQGDYCFLAISGWRSARCMASPMVYDLVPANTGERTAAEMIIDPLSCCDLFADKGFLGLKWQTIIFDQTNNLIWMPRRSNQKYQNSPGLGRWLSKIRERIEGVFHEIQDTGRNIERLLAKTALGLTTRLIAKMTAHNNMVFARLPIRGNNLCLQAI